MPSHHHYDFRRLPERTKRQIARSIADGDLHLRDNSSGNKMFYFTRLLGSALAAIILISILCAAFGKPGADHVWSNVQGMVGLATFIALGAGLALAVRRRVELNKVFSFPPGQYMFPFTLIDARRVELEVVDLTQLKGIEMTEHRQHGFYSHTTFAFSFHDAPTRTWKISGKKRAEQFGAKLNALQAQARAAFDRSDMAAVLRLDPFFEIRNKNWQPLGADPAPESMWKKRLADPVLCALAVAILLSPLIWTARNVAADFAVHAEAKRLQTEAAYQAYIDDGWFYTEEMRAAIPRVAFAEVKQKKSVNALRDLLIRYPKAGLQADVGKEIHVLFQRALAKFMAQAPTSDPALLASMTQLLQVLEQRGDPMVGIRFTRPSTDALAELDARIKRNEAKLDGKTIIPAAAHFASDSAAVREARIVTGLQAGFGRIFPNDVLKLQLVAQTDTRLPVLTIDYQIEPSGMLYLLEGSERAFVGLVARFQSGLSVGTENEPWRFNMEVEPPNQFRVNYSGTKHDIQKGPADSQVYSVMAERAFDALAEKMHAAFFRPDSAPAKDMKVVSTP